MTISSAFESNQEMLKKNLETCHSVEESSSLIQLELDRMTDLMAQNTEDDLTRKRARAVMAVCRIAPKLICSCSAKGELFFEENEKVGLRGFIPKLEYVGFILLISIASYEAISGRITPALLILVSMLIIFISKRMETDTPGAKARGIATINTDRMISLLGGLCRATDTCIEDLDVIEKENSIRHGELSDNAFLSLMENLMEAKFAGREDMALESLDEVEQYLRLMGIEMVLYDPSKDSYFEILPTLNEDRTIRPAFVKGGNLLRRGVAVKHA